MDRLSKQRVHSALSSQTRIDILKLLYKKPYGVEELAEKLKLAPVSIRHHLRSLEEAGILECYDKGSGSAGRPKTYYKIVRSPPTVSFPERRYIAFAILLLDSMIDLVGRDEVAGILSVIGQRMGKETVDEIARRNRITKWTPKEFEQTFVGQYLQEAGTEPEVVEKTDKKVVLELHNCIFSELALKMPDLMCEVAHMQFFKSVAEAMNGSIVHTHTACMARGDDFCEHVFEWNHNQASEENHSLA